jgi:hypothetical protein
MTGPRVLVIDQETILAPSRSDLDRIAALMLWPHNPALRDEAGRSSLVEDLHSSQDDLPLELLRQLTTLAKDSLPLGKIQEQLPEPFGHGLRCGLYLQRTVASVLLKQPLNLGALVKELSAIPPEMRDTKKFTNIYWPRYRPVSHFWAATIDLADGRGFPCRGGDLLRFLKLAEGYRILGEKSRTKQAPRPILKPNESICIDPPVEPDIPEFEPYRQHQK